MSDIVEDCAMTRFPGDFPAGLLDLHGAGDDALRPIK